MADQASRVVVGVDGSVGADRALGWAVREARDRHAVLELCSFWHLPLFAGYAGVLNSQEFADVARDITDKAAARAAELAPEVEVRTLTLEGYAAPGLVQQSKGAELLVVGSRGLGGFHGMVLGSVSRHCAEHAHCPVLIVREPDRRRSGHDGGAQ